MLGGGFLSDLSTCVPDAGKSHTGKYFGIEILGRLNCRIHKVLSYLAWVLRRNLLVIYLVSIYFNCHDDAPTLDIANSRPLIVPRRALSRADAIH